MVKDEAVTATPSPALDQQDLEIPSGEAYDHWRKTGELPSDEAEVEKIEQQQREEEENASREREEASAASAEKKSVKSAGAEPAAKPQQTQGTKRDANSRIRQLNEELTKERETRIRLEERLAAGTARVKDGVTAESPTAKPDASKQAATEPTIEDKDDKGEFKYKTVGEYQRAWQKWVREDLLREANKAFDERFTKTQEEREKQAKIEHHRTVFGPRVEKARQKYADFNEVAFRPDLPIVEGSLIEGFILESEIGPEIAYYLGQHPEEITKITGLSQQRNEQGQFLRVSQGMPQITASRYLAMLELSLMEDEEAGGEGTARASAAPAQRPSAAKPVTRAPQPPARVEGKAPSAKSDEARALDDDDFESYRNAANNREIAARKGRK